jgi:hypothetical protein
MLEASGNGEPRRKPTTLKKAALKISPVSPKLNLEINKHHLYFEIMKHAGVAV